MLVAIKELKRIQKRGKKKNKIFYYTSYIIN